MAERYPPSQDPDMLAECYNKAIAENEALKQELGAIKKQFQQMRSMHNTEIEEVREVERYVQPRVMSLATTNMEELKPAVITRKYEDKLVNAIYQGVEPLFTARKTDEAWLYIRDLLKSETDDFVDKYTVELCQARVDAATIKIMVEDLRQVGIAAVVEKSREMSRDALNLMKRRFKFECTPNRNGGGVWTGKENIDEISKDSWQSCLQLLSVLAITRLDDEADNIKTILEEVLIKSTDPRGQLTSSSWNKIPAHRTLLTPAQCRTIWGHLYDETKEDVKALEGEIFKILKEKKARKLGYFFQCFSGTVGSFFGSIVGDCGGQGP